MYVTISQHWQKKHTFKKPKLVNCSFCARQFKSPSAYAQHIESGIHRVTRHQVTQAVHTLRVFPQITIAPTIEYNAMSRIEAVDDDLEDQFTGHPSPDLRSADPHPFGHPTTEAQEIHASDELVEPGPPLSAREEEAPAAVTTEPPAQRPAPTTDSVVPARRFGPERLDVAFVPTTYVPADFVNQGIPYACPICLKTFRNVFALSSHMNSPVHDPDAFMCPKCNKHFRLVSGLIQHLESGSCGLASPSEIHDRFAKLTARFSRLLIA